MHQSETLKRRPTSWRPMPGGARPEPSFGVSLMRVSAGDGRPLSSRLTADGTSAPGNGLFELVQRRAAATRSWDIAWRPERLSASFHGRDLFAPVAAA